jgi:glycosyltransferase involved in cell wall biosynthesis
MTPAKSATDISTKRRKVLVATDEMEVGGSQRQITNLLTGIDQKKVEPILLYFRKNSFLVDQIKASGVRVHYLPKAGRIDPGFLVKLVRFLATEKFDVIHAYSLTAELWLAIARMFTGAPRIISSIRSTYDNYAWWQWRLKQWITGQSALVISNSRMAADQAFDRMALPVSSCAVVYNGIRSPTTVHPLPPDRSASRGENDFILTFVGRLGPEKNLPCLLRALHRLQQQGARRRIGVWLVGDGSERANLEGKIAELALDHVDMLGERQDVEALFAHSDAVVLPSIREGLSNAILEAMASGKPVIASAVGGSPEIVRHEENGLLFPSNDDQALADAIARLYDAPAFRVELGALAKTDVVERFSIASMVQQFERHYGADGVGRPILIN